MPNLTVSNKTAVDINVQIGITPRGVIFHHAILNPMLHQIQYLFHLVHIMSKLPWLIPTEING
jgi:hypothetical protein